jgi:two-component system sensor kinase FixL
VSFTLPVIVSVEAGIILWLLTLLARRDRYTGSHQHAMHAHSFAGGARTGLTQSAQQSTSYEPPGDHQRHGRRSTGAVRAFRWPMRVRRACPGKAGEGISAPSGAPQRSEPQQSSISAHGAGEDGFRELWETFPFAIVLLDQQGKILMANLRAHSLFGYERGELPGVLIAVLIPEPTHRDGFLSTLRGVPFGPMGSFVARRKDGSELPLKIGLRRSTFRSQMATLAFLEDMSDHYGLLQNQQDLAHLTRVSTMGELAGSLAHELNQPLTAILSNVQAAQRFMAADPVDVLEVREILNDIVQDDYRASEVIRRIRSVVRKTDLEFAFVDLAVVVREVVVLLYSEAIMRGARITQQSCAALPVVYADKVQLQQVVLNLLLNAFDAMSHVLPGERVVSIELAAQGDDTVVIAVRDCGQGLTVGKLDTVFKPFHTSKPHGLGLGLSISRSIVELHGGRIWAENNINRGATFFVSLPAGKAAWNRQSR